MTNKKRRGPRRAGRAVREAGGTLDLRVQRRTAELEKANAELRKVEEHLRLATQVGGMVTWEIDPATGSIQYSGNLPQIVRGGSVTRYYSRESVLKEIHPEDRERLSQALDRLFTHNHAFECEYRVKMLDGTYRWILGKGEAVAMKSGEPRRLVGISLDIDGRKQAEEKLRESQERQRRLMDILPDSCVVVDLQGRIQSANQRAAQLHGFESAAELEGLDITQLVAPDHRQRVRERIKRSALEATDFEAEYPVYRKDGTTFFLEVNTSVLLNAAGQAEGLIALGRDLTERKRAEQAFRESELRNRTILHTAMDGFWINDLQGNILEVNDAYCRMTGYTGAELLRMRISDLEVNEPRVQDVLKHLERIAKLGQEKFQTRQRCKDGRIIDLEISVTCLMSGEPCMFSFFRDITERVRLERQIMEVSDRVQANFGSEIHDGLCQTLVTAAFDANSLNRRLAATTPLDAPTLGRLCRLLDDAITEGRRLSQGLIPVRLSADGLTAALQALVESIGRRTGLCTRFTEKGGPVLISDQAAAIHLFRIAQEAMNNAVKHARARRIAVRLAQTEQSLALTVTDDGTGIFPEAHTGFGLGLHIMEYRARALDGTLQIRARPGRGTEVLCRLPWPLSPRVASDPKSGK